MIIYLNIILMELPDSVKSSVHSDESETEYLPVELLDPTKIMTYEKEIFIENDDTTNSEEPFHCQGFNEQYIIHCLLSDDGKCHIYDGYNRFTMKKVSLPSKNNGWKDIFDIYKENYEDDKRSDETFEKYVERCLNRRKEYIYLHICDPTAKIFSPGVDIFGLHHDKTMHKTLDNGGIGYYVFICPINSTVHVYGRTQDILTGHFIDEGPEIFTNLIGVYQPLNIFIGKSSLNEMTGWSGGHGDRFDGNTILLRIGNLSECRYLHIGSEIFQFETDELVIKYVSSVGNSGVPYPYAETKTFCYSILDKTRSLTCYHPDRETKGYVSFVPNISCEPYKFIKIASRDSFKSRYSAKTFYRSMVMGQSA